MGGCLWWWWWWVHEQQGRRRAWPQPSTRQEVEASISSTQTHPTHLHTPPSKAAMPGLVKKRKKVEHTPAERLQHTVRFGSLSMHRMHPRHASYPIHPPTHPYPNPRPQRKSTVSSRRSRPFSCSASSRNAASSKKRSTVVAAVQPQAKRKRTRRRRQRGSPPPPPPPPPLPAPRSVPSWRRFRRPRHSRPKTSRPYACGGWGWRTPGPSTPSWPPKPRRQAHSNRPWRTPGWWP